MCVVMAHWKQHEVCDHSAHLCPHEPSPLSHLLSGLFFPLVIIFILNNSNIYSAFFTASSFPSVVKISLIPSLCPNIISLDYSHTCRSETSDFSCSTLSLTHTNYYYIYIVCVRKVADICYPVIVVYVPNVDRKCNVQALFHLYIVLYLFCRAFIDLWVQMCL